MRSAHYSTPLQQPLKHATPQAVKLIPADVWERASVRAEQEPLRLAQNWAAACCVFLLWDACAVVLAWLLCSQLGPPWWRSHWWVVAASVAGVMLLAEAAWAAWTLRSQRRVVLQKDKTEPEDLGVNEPLIL